MFEELRTAAQRVLARESDGIDSTFMADILALVTMAENGFYEVSASRRVWAGGDYNGHYESPVTYWRFPTLAVATRFIEKHNWAGYDGKPFVRLTPWSTLP